MTLELDGLDATAALERFKDVSVAPAEYAEAIADRALEYSSLNALQSFNPEYLVRNATEAFQANPNALLSGPS